MTCYVLECRPKDSSAAVQFVTFANGYPDDAYLGQAQPYPLRLNNDFSFDASIYSENTPGSTSLTLGSISINNADGLYDYLLAYAWGGAQVVLKSGPDYGGYGTLSTVFTGAAQEIGADGKTLTILLRDASWKMAVPLQKNKYLGSFGKEGYRDLTGLPKPLCYGLNENLTPVLTDQILLCYQVHDGALEALGPVYDDAVPLTFRANYGTYAELAAATIQPGYYSTCLSEGFVRLGAPAAGALTLDARGQFYSQVDLASTLSAILLAKSPLVAADLNQASFAEFSADSPYRVQGLYYAQPDMQVDSFVGELVGTADGFWTIDATAKVTVRRFKFRSPAALIRADDIKDLTRQVSAKPVYKAVVNYRRNMTVQETSSFTIPTNSLVGYLDQEVVYAAQGEAITGALKVFLGTTQVNSLKLIDFQKMSDAPWLTLQGDGSYTITGPAATAQVVVRASVNEFKVDRLLKVVVGQPRIIITSPDPRLLQLTPSGVPVNPAQEITFTVVDAAQRSLAITAVSNLNQGVPVQTVSANNFKIRIADLGITPLLAEVVVSVAVGGVVLNTLTIPVTRGYVGSLATAPTYADGTPIDALKPAQPGATAGAPAGTFVGDKEAAQVVADLSLNGFNALYASALSTTKAAELDALRQLQDGSALTIAISNLKTVVENPDQNVVQTLNLIGAAQPNGNGGTVFVFNQNTALGTPDKLLGQTIDGIQSQVDGHESSITSIKEIVTAPNGSTELRAMTTLNSAGVITGTINTLTGGKSKYAVLADEFRIVSMDQGGLAYTPFSVIDGQVTMIDVVVRKLSYEALVPLFGGAYNQLNPAGGFQVIPGGFIIQWGQYRSPNMSERAVNITFPIPFPNALMSTQATAYINSTNQINRDIWMQVTSVRDRTMAQFQSQANEGGNTVDGFDWVAFGY
jgi:hypothetical protein